MKMEKIILIFIVIIIIILLAINFKNIFTKYDENGFEIENYDVYEINKAIRENDYDTVKEKVNSKNVNKLPLKSVDIHNPNYEDDVYPDNEIEYDNEPPLVVACTTGNYKIVKLLIDNGANVNYKKSDSDDTPLFDLIVNSKRNEDTYKILKLLLEKDKSKDSAEINRLFNRFVAISYVSKENDELSKSINLKIFKLLYRENIENIKKYSDTEKADLLIDVVRTGNLDILKYLIEVKKYDANLKDAEGKTALDYAMKSDNKEIIELLS